MRLMRAPLPRLVAVVLYLWSALPAVAAPREDLLQLVPEDASLCLVVNNLREHGQKLRNAPWLAGLAKTELGKAILQAKELEKLQQLDKDVKQFAQVGWEELRDDILGDCVVLAYYHAAKKEDERGLLLLSAKDPKLLDKLINLLNQQQKKNGEVKAIQEKEYRGVKYALRQEVKQNQFYWRQDALFLFTTDEALLRKVIDRRFTAIKPSSLVRSFGNLGADQAVVTLWVNPRPFDAQWKATSQDSVETATAKQAFAQYWHALDAVVVSLTAGKHLEITVALQGRSDALPLAAQKFLKTVATPSELWQLFPAKSVVTAAARIDAAALAQMLEEFTPVSARPKLRENLQQKIGAFLGMNLAQDVLPRLGPDVGYCLAPSAVGKPLPDMWIAVKIQPGPKDTPLDQALLSKLEFLRAVFNGFQKDPADYMKLLTQQQDGVEVKYLSQRHFPDGFQPAFALKHGFLVMASSPQAMQLFGPNAAKSKDTPLLHLSLAELSQLLKAQRSWFQKNIADKNQFPEQAAGKWLDNTLEVFSLLDHLHISQEFIPGQATWTIRLQMN